MTDADHDGVAREVDVSPVGDGVEATAVSTRRSSAPPDPAPPDPRGSAPPHAPIEPDDATIVSSGAGRRGISARTPPPGPVRRRATSAEADPGASVDATVIARGRRGARTAGDGPSDATSIAARRQTPGTANDEASGPADDEPIGRDGIRPRGRGATGPAVTSSAPTDGGRMAYVPDAARLAARQAPRPANPVVVPRAHVGAPAGGDPVSADVARAARERRVRRRVLLMLYVVIAAAALAAAVSALVLLLR